MIVFVCGLSGCRWLGPLGRAVGPIENPFELPRPAYLWCGLCVIACFDGVVQHLTPRSRFAPVCDVCDGACVRVMRIAGTVCDYLLGGERRLCAYGAADADDARVEGVRTFPSLGGEEDMELEVRAGKTVRVIGYNDQWKIETTATPRQLQIELADKKAHPEYLRFEAMAVGTHEVKFFSRHRARHMLTININSTPKAPRWALKKRKPSNGAAGGQASIGAGVARGILKTAGDGTATMSKIAKRVVWRDICIMEYELSAQEKQYKRSLLRFLEEEARLRKCQAARLRKRFFDYWRGSSVQQQQDGGEISPPPSPSLEAEQDEEVEVRLEEDEFEAASSMAEPDGGVPDGMGGSGEYWPPHFEDPVFGRLEDAEFGPLGDLDSIGIEDDLQLVEDAFVRIVRPRRE